MRKLGLLFLLLFSLGLIDAQKLSIYPTQKYKANAGEEMLRQGKQLAEFDNNYTSALRCYQKAADIFLKELNWEKYVETLNGIGRVYNDLAEYQKAEKYLIEALYLSQKHLGEKHKKTAYSYFSLASTKSRSGQSDSSLIYCRKALDIYTQSLGSDSPEVGMVLFQIGFVYGDKTNYDKSIEYCRRSITIREAKLGENDAYVAAAYNNIGWAYGRKGNYDNLFKYCKKGLEIRKRIFGENHIGVAISYITIAYGYILQRNYGKQLDWYKKTLIIYRHIFGEQHRKTADAYRFIGFTYMQKGDYAKQIEYYEKALAIYEKTQGEDLFYPYLDLAGAYLRLNEREKALDCYKKACLSKKTARESGHPLIPFYEALVAYHQAENNPPKQLTHLSKAVNVLQKNSYDKYLIMAETRNMQGECFLKLGKVLKALEAFQQGLIAVSDKFNSTNAKDNPDIEKSNSKYLLLSLLANKARTLSRLGETQEEKSYSETALKTYEEALLLLDNLRIGMNSDEFKEKVTAKYAPIYEQAVEIGERLYAKTQEQDYLKRAFYASERNKAFLMHEASAESRAKEFAGIPQHLLKQEKELKSAIAVYEEQMLREREKNNEELVKKYENQATFLRDQLEVLISKFEKEYPEYYTLKYATEPASVERLQASLEDNTALAEYLVGERNLYVFLLSKNTLKLLKTDKPPLLAERIETLQSAVLTRNFEGYAREAHRLYLEVFEPLRKHLATAEQKPCRLTVVPDGPLWYLNFELLLSGPPPSKDYAKLPYLLKEYTFGYAYSATLRYGNLGSEKAVAKQNQCLAFSYSGGNGTYAELPGSKTELKAIERYRKGTYLNGRQANEATFKQLAPNHAVLHLALHGEVDDRRPERSALYFPAKQTDISNKKEDGVLYAAELYNMHLNAELAVLSACHTGSGKLIKGEGIISLGRAFTYAGCKSLVMSLWEVSDATAPEIMEQFYKYLNKGLPKDEALSKAKLAYLASADNLSANPFYWGSFVMLGDQTPLPAQAKQAPQRADVRPLLAGILLLGMFGMYSRKLFGQKKSPS